MLYLDGDGVADTAEEHFKSLPSLRLLDLRNSRISAPCAERLHGDLPVCTIVSDHGTFEAAPSGN